MQWILQEDEENFALAEMLDRMGIAYSMHTKLRETAISEPIIDDPNRVIIFGYYSALTFVRERGYHPGVFELNPYVLEEAWQPYLLNPRKVATFVKVRDILDRVPDDERKYFVRPVADSKTMSGLVLTATELRAKARAVMCLAPEQIVPGKLEPNTELLLSTPITIHKEWRVWVVSGVVVTWSLYKMAGHMVTRPEIDQDALDFVAAMIEINPDYSEAYVIDVCRTEAGLKIIETNCINASGYYEADLQRLINAIENINPTDVNPSV
jgi:hypothetical protein